MIQPKMRFMAIVAGAALGTSLLVGAASKQGDFCAGTVTDGSSLFRSESACFNTSAELTQYLRDHGVDVPDGLYDR